MLHLAGESVDMSKAVRDWSFQESEFIKWGMKPGESSFSVAGGKVEWAGGAPKKPAPEFARLAKAKKAHQGSHLGL
jgi:hypothetical protein